MLHVAAEVEVEPQRKIYDEWGNFVARADLWVVWTRRVHEYDGEAHATKNDTAQTSGAKGAWLRLFGSASGSPHRSSSMRQHRSSLGWIGCWAGPGIRGVWRDGRPCSTSRCSGLAVRPEQSVAGNGLSKADGRVLASCGGCRRRSRDLPALLWLGCERRPDVPKVRRRRG